MKKAEFDLFAAEYSAMHEKSLGNFGDAADYFADYKILDIARELDAQKVGAATRRALDFGAGCGNSIAPFHKYLPEVALTCLDVSQESLDIGRASHAHHAQFVLYDGVEIPMPAGSFDLAFSACVFHHIAHQDHPAQLKQLHRVLREDGLLFIFEHNPLNPLTVRVVNRCPFDVNAHLIRSSQLKQCIERAGFVDVTVRYRLFFPSVLRFLRPLERFLAWLPLGAQYYVRARKAA